jgi:hypothetical protein
VFGKEFEQFIFLLGQGARRLDQNLSP